MKNILLIDADGDSVGLVMMAAARGGHAVRLATRSDEAFKILHCGLYDIDLVVLDADPGGHPMALLEAMSGYSNPPPVVVLTGLEEEYMSGVVAGHGAAACIGKPLSVEKLRSIIARLSPERRGRCGCSCDAWGHVQEEPALA